MDLAMLVSGYDLSRWGEWSTKIRIVCGLTLDGRMVTKHRRDVGVIDKSKLNRPPLRSPIQVQHLLASCDSKPDLDVQRQQRQQHDPPADQSDASGSTQYVPVEHHATHRCLTPTRKTNSGETITRRISWRDNEHVPPSRSPSCLASFYSSSSLVVLVPPGGVSGYDQATGNEEGEREREKAGGLHSSSYLITTHLISSEPVWHPLPISS
jgi:hypothetical protein